MSDFITPTVGRVVWFYPASNAAESDFSRRPGGGPYAALIAHVWHDRMVNLSVLDANGNPHSRTSVPMVQGDDPAPDSAFCGWMPFQKGQAKAQNETRIYNDGTVVTDPGRLPAKSPEQDSLYAAIQVADVVNSAWGKTENQDVSQRVQAAIDNAGDLAKHAACSLDAIRAEANARPSRRDELEQSLVSGAAHTLASNPNGAKELAEGIREFLNVLHPVVGPNLINLPPLAAGTTIDVVVSEPGDAGRMTTYKLETKAGIATAITCNTSAAVLPAAALNHASAVLYPAIKKAMERIGQPPFNTPTCGYPQNLIDAYDALFEAFWSECPIPASVAYRPSLHDAG